MIISVKILRNKEKGSMGGGGGGSSRSCSLFSVGSSVGLPISILRLHPLLRTKKFYDVGERGYTM